MHCVIIKIYLYLLTKKVFFNEKMTFLPLRLKKYLYYSVDRDETLHTYVKSKIKWGKCLELFSIFFIENQLLRENAKKGCQRHQ